jgi:Type II secretion system (T2SS), protein N
MSLKSALCLAVAIFALTVLALLPAGLVATLLAPTLLCDSPSGTIWGGSCGVLRSGTLTLSDVHWSTHPAGLLRARLILDLVSMDPRAVGRTRLTAHINGELEIDGLEARLPLENGLSLFPSGWSGSLELAIEHAVVRHGQLSALQGRARLLQLRSVQPSADLGSIELDVPAPAGDASGGTRPIVGALRDIGGPLSLQGQAQLSGDGAYEISGTVVPRSGASPDLQQALQLLGPPDAQGRYAFSLAGTI